MALLARRFASRRQVAPAALLASAAALAGCVLLEGARGRELAFSHRVHVVDQRLDCFSCHEDARMAEEPGMPPLDQCLVCHEEIDAEKPEARRVESLFRGERFDAAHASRLDDEVIFSHRAHTGYAECGACHAGIEESERIGREVAVGMAACMDCHERRGAPTACESCHREIRAEREPESHEHAWLQMHGQVVRAASERTADNCQLCHQDSSCIACHMEDPPKSHTIFFRRRGHGLIAALDREGCAVCHRSDSCERCHRETLPASHTGAWGGTMSLHCLACHVPLKEEGCSACHVATPSHALAAPKPPDHNPAMNCRMCHGVTVPLPHVDNGDDCNICHL